MNTLKTVLILAAHTDDAEFGCGGTVARFREEGRTIHYMVFSTAIKSLPVGLPEDTLDREQRAAFCALGFSSADLERLRIFDFDVRTFPSRRQDILELLVVARNELQPDLVLLPSLHDIHQDHQTVAQEGLRAFKHTTVLGYELPWNNLSFNNQAFVALERRHVEAKARALSCYASQQHRGYANPDYVWGWAQTRGISANCAYAETFEVYRWMI
jgi:LmbE family N-acetylglucosaminyl deacetylase